jgi:7-carboxy-7-deazaguanine synthase (Cx14CxxC type)
MAYVVKEIFYTLQGEGANAGRPAVFLRFSGCNLWSGREEDRSRGPGSCAAWCDTDFFGTNGTGGGKFASASALADSVAEAWPNGSEDTSRFVVCTGGEPLLQLDDELIAALRRLDFAIAVETNGTVAAPKAIDWLTVSPKAGTTVVVRVGDELKLIYPQVGVEPSDYERLEFRHFFVQPMDGPQRDHNTQLAVRYCLEHPRWRLSLQTHKFLGIQ